MRPSVCLGGVAILALRLLQIATAFPVSRQRRAPCFSEKEQFALETAQRDCIEETAEQFGLKDGDTDGDPAAISVQLYRLLDYFTQGMKPRAIVAPRVEILDAFTKCFEAKAAAATAELSSKNKPDDFGKTYLKHGLLVLLDKVNLVECKSKFVAVNVLDNKYEDEVRQEWKKLGPIRRAFKSFLTTFAGWFNKEYVECFTKDKIKGATLPMLMCVSRTEQEIQEIFQKCLNDNLLPAAKKELEKRAEQPNKNTVQLGERWRAFIDAWVCDKKSLRSKRSVQGAGRIIRTWPASMLVGAFGAAGVAVFYTFAGLLISGAASYGFCALCGATGGAFVGALTAVGMLLYCFIGVPIRSIGQLFSRDTSADDYNHAQAMADVTKVAKYFWEGR